MDFHRLTRRELQDLCKMNNIPANLTNVAMADALQALQNTKRKRRRLPPPETTPSSLSWGVKEEVLPFKKREKFKEPFMNISTTTHHDHTLPPTTSSKEKKKITSPPLEANPSSPFSGVQKELLPFKKRKSMREQPMNTTHHHDHTLPRMTSSNKKEKEKNHGHEGLKLVHQKHLKSSDVSKNKVLSKEEKKKVKEK